jgi:hypothetical protein
VRLEGLGKIRNEYRKQYDDVPGSRAQPVRKAENITAICESTVDTMWDP